MMIEFAGGRKEGHFKGISEVLFQASARSVKVQKSRNL
jgi:hypothetical protein